VEPLREECFFEDLSEGDVVDASVLVYRGGKLDVKLRIESPTKQQLHESLIFSNIDDHTGKIACLS
jgi:hypothetical protein